MLSFGALLFPFTCFLAVKRASPTCGGCSGFGSTAIRASLDLSFQALGNIFLCCNKNTSQQLCFGMAAETSCACMHALMETCVSHLCVQRDHLSLEGSLSVLGLMQPSQAPGHN